MLNTFIRDSLQSDLSCDTFGMGKISCLNLGRDKCLLKKDVMRGSRGGSGGSGLPLEFAKLNIADITGNEKISYFSYLCTSTVIRQGRTPPVKNIWISAWMSTNSSCDKLNSSAL